LWREEQGNNLVPPADSSGSLRSVGVSPGGIAAEQAGQDAEAPEGMAAAAEAGDVGADATGAAPAPGP